MAEIKQKMDIRTCSRYVEKGIFKDSDIQAHLKSLPDETNNAVCVDLTVEDVEALEDDASEELTDESEVETPAVQVQPVEEGT